ncbi:response regulator transcription factor [Paenibacillus sp. FSL M8-0228]|jgi:DNA-binding response OmpR family regulator|uniref:Response regulator transcription factor n=1 Tax=Paenibacillus polymyxa TaxID=1406 RepID=A0A8I1IS60_PAEPO|nr:MULTISPECIES: response regulator transcription factor [Paenibacillus]KAF6566539.1 response regulator transcription factor [Paenibacillus sp. EKM206P]KAF6584539.1 response regulator transcription factor [Paenibacillus sp. EKM205P]MBM0636299.1 response regulator transcription factor [Paenibacillus polymyxa]MBO3284584.1 response regulator transcription factor [Paenibacillus polymyxa]MBP1312719.1 DNA-binding response OmpR family regulator [Paenibacillus sp. 1182]
MHNGTILLVDDEPEIIKLMQIYLENEGYRLLMARDGLEALEQISRESIDVMVLDVMMPNMDGVEACMKIRETEHFPIIMLSAKGQDMDKITGLSVGADDYVTKPFSPLELVARIKSQLRRVRKYTHSSPVSEHEMILDELSINSATHEVTLAGESIKLTPREFAIVELLARNRGQVLSMEQIYEKVWKEQYLESNNTLMVHVRKIREKIEADPRKPKYLKTVWGIGYKMEKFD